MVKEAVCDIKVSDCVPVRVTSGVEEFGAVANRRNVNKRCIESLEKLYQTIKARAARDIGSDSNHCPAVLRAQKQTLFKKSDGEVIKWTGF